MRQTVSLDGMISYTLFVNNVTDKDLISKIHKQHATQQQRTKNPTDKWAEEEQMERCSISLIIREMQIKTIRLPPHASQNGQH